MAYRISVIPKSVSARGQLTGELENLTDSKFTVLKAGELENLTDSKFIVLKESGITELVGEITNSLFGHLY